MTSDDTNSDDTQEVKSEYFRQLVFLNTSRCPYTPNMLHLIHIAAGTVLVLVNEVNTLHLSLVHMNDANASANCLRLRLTQFTR